MVEDFVDDVAQYKQILLRNVAYVRCVAISSAVYSKQMALDM